GRVRAFRRTNTRRELFDHPDGDPRVIGFLQPLVGTRPQALAVTGLVAPRRVAAAVELALRLPQTRSRTATAPPVVVQAADLMAAGRGRSRELVLSTIARAGRRLLLVEGLGPLTDRGRWEAGEAACALVD